MQRTVILIASGYVLGNLIILSAAQLLSFVLYGGIATFIGIMLCVAYNCVCVYFMLEYLKKLDMIIDASSRHESVNFGTAKVPESLNILASNLTNTNEALEKAVEKAVRDEQMKTELITNVSHDLKTPLTSLISYSNLLSKCDVKDENAVKYISVINNPDLSVEEMKKGLREIRKEHSEYIKSISSEKSGANALENGKGKKKSVLADLHEKQEKVSGTNAPKKSKTKKQTKEIE